MFSPVVGATLAVVIAAAGTICYALGIATQHHAVEGQPEGVGIKQFLRLFLNKKWLLGALGIGGSALCHLTALTLAPIQVVQPIGILAIIWAVLLEDHRRSQRSSRGLWAAVLSCAGGLLIFIIAASTHAAPSGPLALDKLLYAVIPIALLSVGLSVAGIVHKTAWRKALLCAAGAACGYGLATGLIKVALVALGRYGLANWWTWGAVVGLIIIYPVAGWVLQQAFGAGAASVAVGAMTTTDPVMAVVFGLIALNEGARLTWFASTIMVVFGLVAIGAVVVLSRLRKDL